MIMNIGIHNQYIVLGGLKSIYITYFTLCVLFCTLVSFDMALIDPNCKIEPNQNTYFSLFFSIAVR